jgi:ABC-type branched-subunit amino acid transport system ATPase component
MSAILVKDLVKRYGPFTALQDVSFEVASGQVTALLGPNGAGKTTTIEIIEGFLAPTAGTVQVLGTDPRSGGRGRARIGLVLQTTSLDAQLTVTEALMMFGALYPKPRRVAEVLDLIDLASDARTRIGALSGGQRRRVDLGLAIIGQPEMLFLDEPTTGLDPEARRRAVVGHRERHRGWDHRAAHHPLPGRGAVPGQPGYRAGRRAGGPDPARRDARAGAGKRPAHHVGAGGAEDRLARRLQRGRHRAVHPRPRPGRGPGRGRAAPVARLAAPGLGLLRRADRGHHAGTHDPRRHAPRPVRHK